MQNRFVIYSYCNSVKTDQNGLFSFIYGGIFNWAISWDLKNAESIWYVIFVNLTIFTPCNIS